MALLLALAGWGGMIGLATMIYHARQDRFFSQHGRYARDNEMPEVWVGGVFLAVLMMLCIAGVWTGPFLLGAFLIVASLFRRVPTGSDFAGRPTHYRWVIRYGLLDLLAVVFFAGLTMGWYFYISELSPQKWHQMFLVRP